MGMAASQARFLQLTARRTNIEYMGQQINQQRLALANASAGLFEKMLTLETPTPPSSQDDKYYKQGYTFTDSKDNVQKQISWSTADVTTAEIQAAIGGVPANIHVTGATTSAGVAIPPASVAIANLTSSTPATKAAAITSLYDAINGSGAQAALPSGYTQVIRNVTITHSVYDPDGNYKDVTVTTPALLEFDASNRLIKSTLLDKATMNYDKTTQGTTDTPDVPGDGTSMTYGGVFDNPTYQNDMNAYEFKKASYDYQVERINQETKIIQTQDKSLELKMKQLDTEHNAVQTEMEAVQKVLQKNIEGSFKTFA